MTDLGKRAGEAEKAEKYEEAFNLYMSALDVFGHLIKYEKNPQLVKVYKEKMG